MDAEGASCMARRAAAAAAASANGLEEAEVFAGNAGGAVAPVSASTEGAAAGAGCNRVAGGGGGGACTGAEEPETDNGCAAPVPAMLPACMGTKGGARWYWLGCTLDICGGSGCTAPARANRETSASTDVR